MTVLIKDLNISKEIDAAEMSTVRGADGRSKEPPCTWVRDDDTLGQALCSAQEAWYQTFGFLLPD